jgi:hypothetical protein
MPEGEKSLWDRLPADKKKQAVMRLAALVARSPVAAPEGMKRLSAQSAAEMAQVAVQTFYSIEKRWRSVPSIESLGINAPGKDNRRAETAAKQQVRTIVRRLLRKNPDWDAPGVYEAVKEEMGEETSPSFGTVLRLIRDMRHYFPTTGVFGRRIVFDSAGLDLLDEFDRRLRLCAALDDETGLILGWDLAPDRSVLIGHRFAARHALHGRRARFDVREGVDRTGFQDLDLTSGFHATSYPEEIELRVLPKDCILTNLDWPMEEPGLKIVGVPKLGSRLMDVLGERVAGLWLGVGIRKDQSVSYRTGRTVSMPVANITTFGLMAKAIAQHNTKVLEAQALGGISPTGSIVDGINASLRALIEVIPLKG